MSEFFKNLIISGIALAYIIWTFNAIEKILHYLKNISETLDAIYKENTNKNIDHEKLV